MQRNEYAPILFLKRRSAAQPFALLVCLLLSVAAWSQTAYVTDGTGHDVLAVDRINHTVTTIKSLKQNQGNTIDLRVGGDNRLYLLTPNNVFRMNLDGTGFQTVFSGPAPPSGFTGIRFDSAGDAFVNTPGGVYKFANLIQAAGTKASPFPTPVQITSACTSSGGLAFDAFGDLLIVCNSGSTGNVLQCSAQGLASAPPCTTAPVLQTSGAITGLAVDALGDIFYSSGSTINSLSCGSPECNALSSGYPLKINGGADVPAYIEAVPDPTGTPTADTASFPCNSAAPSILVSTADASSLNGKVYSIDNVASTVQAQACTATATTNLIGTLNTKVPGVGMAAPGTLNTLTKLVVTAPNPTSDFNYGNASLELLPTSAIITACNLSMTKEQLSATAIASRLSSLSPPVSAITFDGEQSWVTGFHGAYDKKCFGGIDPGTATHIGISGFYSATNPHIVLIPDDPKSSPTVDELPFVYPIAPLQGTLGDLLIHNTTPPGVFTTTPATIIVANVGFTNGALANGYLFCGFLPPFVDPATGGNKQNTVKSGQSATFKFQLGVTSCSDLVIDQIAQQIAREIGGTGFSVAEFADPSGTQFCATSDFQIRFDRPPVHLHAGHDRLLQWQLRGHG